MKGVFYKEDEIYRQNRGYFRRGKWQVWMSLVLLAQTIHTPQTTLESASSINQIWRKIVLIK